LEVDMHVIHGHANRLQNVVRLVRATSLEVDDVVFNGIATSLALLSNEQKELGALVIDIGGGTTEFVVIPTASSGIPACWRSAATTFPTTSPTV